MRTYVALIVVIAALAGCTSHRTVTANGGTVTTQGSGDQQTVTYSNGQGTATVGKNAVDPASLGLPVYPGAQTSENGGYSVQSKEGTGQLVMLTTTDSFDQVYAFYKSHMPAGAEQMKMTQGGSSIATFAIGKSGDKAQKTVEITAANGKTSIMLASGSKP